MIRDLRSGLRYLWICPFSVCLLLCAASPASDHADPVDVIGYKRLEPGITDLFVFPVDREGHRIAGFQRDQGIPLTRQMSEIYRSPLTAEQKAEIDSLVIILCVRRSLTEKDTLDLEPYTY
ncbi:MAG: hypothetical protein KDA96_13230, partial [Planctomycetaceae bacterium]|nr:hypothetical protein [Planctomycetaceae bacterium]